MSDISPTHVVGIDPGVRGGIAAIDLNGHVDYVRGFRPDMTLMELTVVLAEALAVGKRTVVYMEKVGQIRGDGAQGAFTFGRISGILEGGVCMNTNRSPHYVFPAAWQARLECLSRGNKNVTKRRAIEIFGGQLKGITHAVADALLIAEYGRRVTAAQLDAWDAAQDDAAGYKCEGE